MGWGQHFFFDCGGGNALAFFWFPDAPEGVPGVSAPENLPDRGELLSAVGSMNHIAFDVPPERIEEYRERLVARGVDVGVVLNHDDSEFGVLQAANSTSTPSGGTSTTTPKPPPTAPPDPRTRHPA
ncbi:VOC family protein [Nonomuraea sp. NPDC003201]